MAPPKSKVPAPKKAPTAVPESTLIKRKTLAEIKAKRDARSVEARKKAVSNRKAIFKRAESYVKEYRQKEASLVRQRRQARNAGNFFIPDEDKVYFVIRIKGIMRVSPKVRKTLQLLRLRQINNGIFLRVNKATANMLQLVQPYITWGAPTLKTVRDLIYKRGAGRVNRQRVMLTDNKVIATSLGSKGIICMEDLVHEIYTCGPNFKEAANFLWPFKLNSPNGGASDKGTGFADGGDAGYRGEHINKLVQQMN